MDPFRGAPKWFSVWGSEESQDHAGQAFEGRTLDVTAATDADDLHLRFNSGCELA